jgi:hypothetical protein
MDGAKRRRKALFDNKGAAPEGVARVNAGSIQAETGCFRQFFLATAGGGLIQ